MQERAEKIKDRAFNDQYTFKCSNAALFLKHGVSDKMATANEMEPTLKMQKTTIKSDVLLMTKKQLM